MNYVYTFRLFLLPKKKIQASQKNLAASAAEFLFIKSYDIVNSLGSPNVTEGQRSTQSRSNIWIKSALGFADHLGFFGTWWWFWGHWFMLDIYIIIAW